MAEQGLAAEPNHPAIDESGVHASQGDAAAPVYPQHKRRPDYKEFSALFCVSESLLALKYALK